MNHFRLPTALCAAPRLVVVCTAVASVATVLPVSQSHAAPNVAGELIVDLRAGDLDGASNTWVNRSSSANSVGDFTTIGGANANVVTGMSDGTFTADALFIDATEANGLISALNTPASVQGNSTRSAEVWLWVDSVPTGGQAPLGWGSTSPNGSFNEFRFSDNTGNGMWSGWFIDAGWDLGAVDANEGITGEWVHVAYTYDGANMAGYINGNLVNSVDLASMGNYPLTTADTILSIGGGPTGPASIRDVFPGYIASVRVHTDVLNASQVAGNFAEGIFPDFGIDVIDFVDDDVIDNQDFTVLLDNLFTSGGFAQGDFNGDGFIDLKDYRGFKDFRDSLAPAPAAAAFTASPVPEPASLACLCLGLACARRTRRR